MRIAKGLLAGIALLATTATGQAQSYGFATYSAIINANGTTLRSSGVASSLKTGAGNSGNYVVTFSRPVDTCVFVLSVVNGNPAYAEAFNKAGDPNSLTVRTYNSSGAASNFPFAVIVSCAS